MYKANINCGVLKQCLDLLIQHNLVKEHILHKRGRKTRVVYAITERGLTALKNIREIYSALQIIEEVDIPGIAVLDKSQSSIRQGFN
jgi:DNA-binding PadR family transcriptional regulator